MSIRDELASRGLSARRADGTVRPRSAPEAELWAEVTEFDGLPAARKRARLAVQRTGGERRQADTTQAQLALLPLLLIVAEGGTLSAPQQARLAKLKPIINRAGANAWAELDATLRIAASDTPETEPVNWPQEPK